MTVPSQLVPRQSPPGSRFGDGRSYALVAVALLLMGALLRVLGYFERIEFWSDEVGWASRIAQGGSSSIRPAGYVWVSKWLIGLRNTEPVVRSLSLASGVLSLPVFLAVCRKAGLSRTVSLFGLFILAVHPAAIDLTKEFKPYALEMFLHLLLLWGALSYLRTRRVWQLVASCAVAAVAPLFSWSIVTLYPGLFLTLGLSAMRRRRWGPIVATVAGALTTFGISLAVYLAYLARVRGRMPKPDYWGTKYDVFYVGTSPGDHVLWLLRKSWEVASFPARLVTFWLDRSASELLALVVVACCVIGVVVILAGRRWHIAGLWLSPWIVTIVLNVFRRWPYGAFRTDLFLLAYSLLLALVGLDALQRWRSTPRTAARLRPALAVPLLAALCVLVFFPSDLDYFASGKSSHVAGNCHARRAIEVIYQAEHDQPPPATKRLILLDPQAYEVYAYYRNNHAETSQRYRRFLRERYRRCCSDESLNEAIDRAAAGGFWLLACGPRSAAPARRRALRRCAAVDELHDFPHGGVLLRCLGSGE